MKRTISRNLIELHGRLAEACAQYNRDTDDITVVAVTKTHPAALIRIAVAAGIHNIGESKIQEAEPKILEVGHIARFHLVGHLQTNKVKKAVQLFDVIQSVDSLKLAEEISRRATEMERIMECYIEINSSGETQKFGVAPQDCLTLVKQIHPLGNIKLTGLMTVGPDVDDEDTVRKAFRKCHELYKRAQDIVGDEFDTLSMGMTHDFPLAIAEGSTMIRVGTGLFGTRDQSN